MAVLKPLAIACDVIICLMFLGGMIIVAEPIALVLALCGASPAVILGAMGACGLVGAYLGRRATLPGAGPSRHPPPYGPSAPRNLASRKIEKLS